MSFKRSQIEDAVYQLVPGEDRAELPMRLKRLMAGDRLLGRSPASKDPVKAEFAFFSGMGPGTGADVEFDKFQAFVVFIGLALLRQGFPQQKVIETLRRVKVDLKRAHRNILATSFESLRNLSSSPPPKAGDLATKSSDPVYLAIASVNSEQLGAVRDVRICTGEDQMWQFMHERTPGNASSFIELSLAAHHFHNALQKTSPRVRGRRN